MKKTSVMQILKIFVLGCSLVGWIVVPGYTQAASKPIKWVLSTPFGSESYGGKGTAWIIERIKTNSKGQLQIEPYYASSLGYIADGSQKSISNE